MTSPENITDTKILITNTIANIQLEDAYWNDIWMGSTEDPLLQAIEHHEHAERLLAETTDEQREIEIETDKQLRTNTLRRRAYRSQQEIGYARQLHRTYNNNWHYIQNHNQLDYSEFLEDEESHRMQRSQQRMRRQASLRAYNNQQRTNQEYSEWRREANPQ